MKKFKYIGTVAKYTDKEWLMYKSSGEVIVNDGQLVLVSHIKTGVVGYYPKSRFNILFEEIVD